MGLPKDLPKDFPRNRLRLEASLHREVGVAESWQVREPFYTHACPCFLRSATFWSKSPAVRCLHIRQLTDATSVKSARSDEASKSGATLEALVQNPGRYVNACCKMQENTRMHSTPRWETSENLWKCQFRHRYWFGGNKPRCKHGYWFGGKRMQIEQKCSKSQRPTRCTSKITEAHAVHLFSHIRQ